MIIATKDIRRNTISTGEAEQRRLERLKPATLGSIISGKSEHDPYEYIRDKINIGDKLYAPARDEEFEKDGVKWIPCRVVKKYPYLVEVASKRFRAPYRTITYAEIMSNPCVTRGRK